MYKKGIITKKDRQGKECIKSDVTEMIVVLRFSKPGLQIEEG